MKTTLSKLKNVLGKAKELPIEKLDELRKVINTSDADQNNLKDNMSIIGNWTEIDDELILDYRDQLLQRLSKNNRKI